MARKPQARTLATRTKLLDAARAAVADSGYAAARVEDIVARAGVAKGTFFAHFRDKDALMDQLIGAELGARLDALDGLALRDAAGVVQSLRHVHDFMTHERYVFDVIIRYSGAAMVEEIGPIAMTFGRYLDIVTGWLSGPAFPEKIDAGLLAEGVQAFAVQAMALEFCALHQSEGRDARLTRYLEAWLRT